MRYICLVLIVLAASCSAYLLHRYISLNDVSGSAGRDFCSAVFGTGCDEALQSPMAVQLGLPLSGWGLVYYGTLISLLILGWSVGDVFFPASATAAFLLSVVAALGSIFLYGLMACGLSPFCPLCAIIHTINLLLVFSLKRLTGRSMKELLQAVTAAASYVFTGKSLDVVKSRWKVVGFLVPALAAVVIYQWVFVVVSVRGYSAEEVLDAKQLLDKFKSSEQYDIPVSEADPQLGPSGRGVRVVVFSDFQCPSCARLALTMGGLLRQFEDSLQLVFKHYPLDSVCNLAISKEIHPGACESARASEAARDQGKFWAFYDVVFMPRYERSLNLKSVTDQLGLDFERFESYRQNEAAAAKIQDDINLGNQLGVDGTPAVFINGRRVYDSRPEALQFLISYELQRHNQAAGQ